MMLKMHYAFKRSSMNKGHKKSPFILPGRRSLSFVQDFQQCYYGGVGSLSKEMNGRSHASTGSARTEVKKLILNQKELKS